MFCSIVVIVRVVVLIKFCIINIILYIFHSVPARILGDSSDVEITTAIGRTLDLTCSVFGVPSPKVDWLTGPDDQPITLSEHFYQSETALQIRDVRAIHSGVYTCEVTNGVGAPVRRTFTVKVKG